MLCENCKHNQASVHTVTIINGVKQEHYLCSECAMGAQFSLPTLMDLLYGAQTSGLQQSEDICSCGNSLIKFQKTGLLGCPECYTTYRSALLPVIKRAQGGRLRHVGRKPQQEEGREQAASRKPAPNGPQDECSRLKEELKAAVAEERYERAAELRDRLRALEGGENA